MKDSARGHRDKFEKAFQIESLKSIAVLPLVNLSSSEENEYFSDGLTEEIINALSKIEGLRVTSRTSSFHFKNKNLPAVEIGRELNVSTLLEGSIRLAGNRMRISTQLIDVEEDYHFWSESFDRSMEDLFAVQDEVSLLIADKLREYLGHFEIEDKLAENPEIPVSAYQQFLKSRYLLLKMSKHEIEEALQILEGLIELYPKFALAYLGMNHGLTLAGTIGMIPFGEAFAKGKSYLDKAIELDESLPECQLHLAWNSLLIDWDPETAYKRLQKVIEKRPIVDYYQTMASTLVAEAKYKAAHNYIDISLQLDPFSDIAHHLKGFIFYCESKFEQAISYFEKSMALKPGAQVSLLYYGQTLIQLDRAKESLSFFRNLPNLPDDLLKSGGITMSHVALGDRVHAEMGIAKLEESLQTEAMERANNLLLVCHTLLGENEKALERLELGLTLRLPLMIYMEVDPILKPLHKYPRFYELTKQILGVKSSFTGENRKYKKSLISQELLEDYKGQLINLMETEQPYLDPDLSLRSLAEMLNLPANQMSQLLNEGFDQNFAGFVNSYRLEVFKEKANNPKLRHLTILALAYESGFNSKTVFNTFFKKAVGMTPSAYWKSIPN